MTDRSAENEFLAASRLLLPSSQPNADESSGVSRAERAESCPRANVEASVRCHKHLKSHNVIRT